MQRFSVIFVILSTMLALLSCNSDDQQISNDMPEMDVKAKNWNTAIRLADDPVLSNSYKNGQVLTLRVENLSDSPIIFLENFGLRVMTKDGQAWLDIQGNFYNGGLQNLPTKASYPLGLLVTTLPYVPDLSSPINIRIIVIGYAENNDAELLGAYYDVKIDP